MAAGPEQPVVQAPGGWRRLLPGLLLVLCAFGAQAVEIQPIRLQVAAGAQAGDLSVRNPRAEVLRLQVDLMHWRQGPDGDVLEPATDALVVPRMLSLEPGATQRLRVGLTAGPRDRERAYRLRIRELPQPAPPDFVGVRTIMEFSVPIFFDGAARGAPPELAWQASRDGTGAVLLQARNDGARHARFSRVRLLDSAGNELARSERPHYVLPGASTRWRLPVESAVPDTLRLGLSEGGNERQTALRLE
ncbi:MAG: molecular chaperone [Xanthomonadales bacterium]|nr:molecular chaperone [Xanthomonadales bacterium]